MTLLFILVIFFSFYSYLFYPLILFFLSKVMGHPWKRAEIRPFVSIIISAYNEEAVIKEKVLNTLAIDYPRDLLEIIVSSDGSTDMTNKIVSEIKDSRLVLRIFERLGKTECLNRVVPSAKGEIILFSDANSMYPPDVLKNLVRNFADQNVGLVTGWTKYRQEDGGEETTGIYAKFEKNTKIWESLVASCVGADGAIFAIRKSLYRSLKDYDINDFVIPLNVIGQGKRVILDSEVYCYEEASEEVGKEYKRQVRITTRTLNAIKNNISFINPLHFGFFSFFLISHKIFRFLVPFFLIGMFVINFFLLNESSIYILCFIGQILIYGAGILGITNLMNGRLINIIEYFLLTAIAQMIGLFRLIIGISDTTWTPQR